MRLILGNLRIAEDRILTYSAVIKTNDQKFMAFNPLALFYFEAETDLKKFMLQRRRWINGSVAGYIYLLFLCFESFKQWDTNLLRKIYVWLLLMCQFLIYFMVSLAPAISLKILYFGINYFLNYYNVFLGIESIIIAIVLWVIFALHLFIHNRNRFNNIIMYTLLILSFLTSIISFASILHYAFVYSGKTILNVLVDGGIILYLGLFVFLGPFAIALILSGKGHSFMYMIKSCIPYFLFMHMLIAWFGSYSYSRTWDLSWRNRPANELNDISEKDRKFIIKKFKEKSMIIIVVIL